MTRRFVLVLAAVAMLASAVGSLGCPVCFGDSDDPIIKGAQASVLFMAGVTYSLLGGGVASVFLLRRRALRLAEQRLELDGAAAVRHSSTSQS